MATVTQESYAGVEQANTLVVDPLVRANAVRASLWVNALGLAHFKEPQ